MIKSSIKSCKNHDLKFTKCPNHKQSQVQNKNNVQQGFNSRCFHISFLIWPQGDFWLALIWRPPKQITQYTLQEARMHTASFPNIISI